MNVIMYGISFDEGSKKVHRLRGGLNVEKGLAFKKLFEYGITSKRILDIMINEAARGRLDLSDEKSVSNCEIVVSKCLTAGLSPTKIIVLRSLYYSFEEPYGLSIIGNPGYEERTIKVTPSVLKYFTVLA